MEFNGMGLASEMTKNNEETALDVRGRNADSAHITGLVFIDPTVPEPELLLRDLPAPYQAICLTDQTDAVDQITHHLRDYDGLETLHIVTHGSPGQLHFSNAVLSSQTLSQYWDQLVSWSTAMAPDAEVLLYGCETGQGEVGSQLIKDLSFITRCTIVASDEAIGHVSLNASWALTLTSHDKPVKASLFTNSEAQQSWLHTLATTLSAGDMAVIEFSSDDSSFRLVSLVDIDAGTVIRVTDRGWTHTNDFGAEGTNEGTITWTVGTAINAGETFEFHLANGSGGNGSATLLEVADNLNRSGELSVSGWTDFELHSAGDQILIYQGTDVSPSFIFGFNNSGNNTHHTADGEWQTSGSTELGSSLSHLPTGLTNGINAIALTKGLHLDNYAYTGPTTAADKSTWISRIANTSNWSGDNTVEQVGSISATAGDGAAFVSVAELSPTITSATYDAATGVLVVTGTNFEAKSGGMNDVDISKLTLIGEGGIAYTLTSATDVEITSATEFSVTLAGADKTNVDGLLNKNGTSSDDSTTFNLAAADDFMANVTAGDTADATSAVTVSNVTAPTISSATYDASTGALVVTGTNFVNKSGVTNDVDVSTFTLTGDSGATYTLTSATDVEITSATEFTITLSATDQLNIGGLLNKDGTTSDTGTTYNLAAADNWMAGAAATTDIADATGNGITVSNVTAPAISSVTYDAATGALVVTGTNFVKEDGATNDVDVSAFTLTGDNGATYTLTASDVEVTSATSFTINLSSADLINVNGLLNKDGATSDAGTTYNLAAADNWMPGAAATTDIADATNGITVSNVTAPVITSATYNASTGALVVTGTNFVKEDGSTNDVDVSTFTLTGDAGATYTLTSATDVEISSATEFTITLSATDQLNIGGLLNKNGTASDDATTYNLAAADNWMPGAAATTDIADATGNGITVSAVAAPTITSATYDAASGVLVVTGTNFVSESGATNDVDISLLTFTGEAGGTRTLTSASDVEVTSATEFSVTLSGADKTAVDALLNLNGTQSGDSTSYNLAAADNWMPGAAATTDIADATGNGITVSNVPVPTVTSATYDAATGTLVVTGTDFEAKSGAANDVDISTLTLTGEGGGTYTLTSATDVEIDSATQFTVTLSGIDKTSVDGLLNKDGTSSDDSTTFNLAAADDFMANVTAGDTADATNAVTVSNVVAPTITSATYDAATGALVVTGTQFVSTSGATNDVDISTLTFTGEGGATYTLTSASDVEVTSSTEFTVTLAGADLTNVESLLNNDGTQSADATAYNLAAADNWMAGAAATTDIADATGNAITVSNYSAPTITSATYDVSTGQLVLTGTNFVNNAGAANDIDASLLTITGDDGATYTLTDTTDVEITSDTAATITLSSIDQLNAHGLLNKDGTTADSGTTYNLAAAEDWMAGAPAANNIVDAAGNGITVSNVAAPTVTSATYDSDTGVLIVTGTNFVKESGAANDVDVSTLTLTGGTGNATYTLTSATDVEVTSATVFSVTLSGGDKTGVDALLDQLGTSSSGGSTYNLAVADNWLAGAAAATDISDTTGNGVTVSISPKITSATYDASTGTLVVTGTNIQANGGGSDIDASLFTLTGEGTATYTLTDTADVERDSATQFTLVLSATDKAEINQILNLDGTSSTGGTTFNLASADDWDTNVTAGDTADTTGNGVTVSNVAVPAITSSTYDAATGSLVVTGTGLLKRDGATNDIDVSTLTYTGEGGETYTLTDSSDVEITSGTEFTVSLSATDKAAINQIVNKDGTSSTSATTYNLAAAEDWAAGADAAVNVVDLAGNGMTVSNVAAPTITSATYTTAGTLVVTGTGLLKKDGAANDIDVSLLTLTGEAGATYTLTDSADVELTSGTEFTVTLSSTDKTAVNALLNKAGTSSTDSTTYNLAAAEDWAVGADAAVNVVDTTGNGITVTIPPAPTPTPSTPAPTTETIDGVDVRTTTQANSDGSATKTQTIAPVTDARIEDTDTSNGGLADIPILQSSGQSQADLSVALPVGIGLEATGSSTPTATSGAKDTLLSLIDQTVPQSQETDRQDMRAGGSSFLEKVTDDNLWVNKLTLTAASGSTADAAVQISGQTTGSNGSAGSDAQQVALVIDASALPSGTVLQLNDVSFAVIVGPATLTGGEGANIIYAGTGSQHIVLGADDDELHGGDGDDTVGSKGGDDLIFGENGNDTLFGGAGADTLHGGADSDTVTYDGAMADYNVTQVNGVVTVALKADASDSDTVINVETLQFSDQSFNPATSTQQEAIATLYQQVLGRQADVTGFQWWAKDIDNGYGLGDVALAFMRSDEYQTKTGGTAFDNLSVDQQVEALYTAVLGRASDSEGKAYWVAEADAGFSIDQMAEAFVTSTELTGQYLQSTQWDFIL